MYEVKLKDGTFARLWLARDAVRRTPCLRVQIPGQGAPALDELVFAARPDRVKFVRGADRVEQEGAKVVGYSADGKVAFHLDPWRVEPGMILVNPGASVRLGPLASVEWPGWAHAERDVFGENPNVLGISP